MSKWEPKTYVLKNGQTLLLREAVPDDAPKVLAYLNRVGGESNNLLFGKDGFPMPMERERAFLESQRKEEKSIMLAGFVGEELVAIASCDALTAREPGWPTGPACPSPWGEASGAWALDGRPWRPSSPLPKARV